MTRRQFAQVALIGVATAAGALVHGRFFATTAYLPVVGLACLAGAATAAVAASRRWPAWSTMLLAAAGFAVLATYAIYNDTLANGLPTSRTGSALRHGIVGGWARILAVEPPADVWDDLLVTPALVVWVAAFTAVTLALRIRNLLAPVAPPLVAFVLALLAAGNQPGHHMAATVAFLTAAVSLILIRAHRTAASGKPPLLTASLTITACVVAGVVGWHVLPLASGQHRFDPRTLRPPPITLTGGLTPLSTLKPQLTEDPPRTLFTVRIDQRHAAQVTQVRTAALDAFDGTTWTTTDTYRVAGSHLAADPALTNARTVTARVDVKNLAGPFLPVLGWPSRFATARRDPTGIGFNARSGVLVSTAPMLNGLRYVLEARISNHDNGLPSAVPSTTPDRALPTNTPPSIHAVARQFIGAHPYAQLTALERFLRSRPYSLSAPPGHSYAAVARLLAGNQTGYAEQHAAAFTVISRALGYPTRIAVGYRLHEYRDTSYTVTSADAHAWPEVHFAGYGWVAFEPTDTSNTTADPPPPPPDVPQLAPPLPSPQTTPRPVGAPPPTALRDQPGFAWTTAVRSGVLLAAGAAALIALTAVVITSAKTHRRRRRRQARHPAARVLGAWQELTDRLAELGIMPPVSLTAEEVARNAATALGPAAHSVTAAAPLATTAVFEPDQLDQRAAERAWQLAAQLHADLYPRRLSTRRLRAAVDPRPLWTSWRVLRNRRLAWQRMELGRY